MSDLLVSSMKLAEAYDTTDATIRNWTARFASFLSDNTRPPEGQARQYNPHDVAILSTVAIMRQQNKKYDDIAAFLESGELLEWQGPPIGEAATTQERQETAVAVAAFQTTLKAYETRLDKLGSQLEAEQAARLAAEIRATAAETELRVIKEMGSREDKTAAPVGWFDRLLGRGRP